MVGQKENIHKFNQMKESNKTPLLTIIAGNHKSGKFELVKEFCKGIKLISISPDVDSIRRMIDTASTDTDKTLKAYVIRNLDELSKQGQNSLLKIFEEPPENTLFFVTVTNLDLTLETILSRGNLFTMAPYSSEELKEFDKETTERIKGLTTPFEILYWKNKDYIKFTMNTERFFEDIFKRTFSDNWLNISKDICYDENEVGFYYDFFFKELSNLILKKYNFKDKDQQLKFLNILHNYQRQNRFKGVRKEDLLQIAILDVYDLLGGLKCR